MELSIWIFVISVVVGPVLLGFLLHRFGFSRAVAIGLGLVVFGAAALISREPLVDSSLDQQATIPSDPRAAPSSPTIEHRSAAQDEIEALRSKLATLEAIQRSATGSGNAALEREKAAHEETRRALDAAKARIAETQVGRAPDQGTLPPETTEPQTIRDELKAARLRLAIAEAEIERLKTAIRAAEPVATAAPLPATPQPFAHAPEPDRTPHPAAIPVKNATEITTGDTAPAGQNESRSATIGRTLAQAMSSRSFALVKLSADELVEGRRGSHYRITCPGKGGKSVSFGSGDYTFSLGDGPLATCFKAVQSLLLDALPQDSERHLYVQGYASQRGFIRPKPLPGRDAYLKSIAYLPRLKGRDRYATATAQQSTGHRFANAELPNLRAAYVAHWIEKASQGAIRPEILEGALKPAPDAESQSFALILQVSW
ncbi:MAG: hypothetical protein AB7E81_24430 [Hyphomicrobiaceae bacterium]